jgi:hypothetical protein
MTCVNKADNRFIAVDYGVSLLIRGILEGKKYYSNEAIMKQFKRNPFYHAGDTKMFVEKLREITFEDVVALVSPIPDEWLGTQESSIKKKLIEGLYTALHAPPTLHRYDA